jgi:hypothetical protein
LLLCLIEVNPNSPKTLGLLVEIGEIVIKARTKISRKLAQDSIG